MDDGRLPERVMFGTIKDGVAAWKTRSPRCPELDRNSHRGRAEVYDRVEEGVRREVQIPPGEENRQVAREPSIYERDQVG